MLQTQSVHSATLELLESLMSIQSLSNFNLVRGTALALQYGHRYSIDLDFFTSRKFDIDQIKQTINAFADKNNMTLEWTLIEEQTLVGIMNNIKIDFIYYPYQLIDSVFVENNVRLLSPKDIAPMKLSAIAQRGSKKDFFDIYELLQTYSLDEILAFYQKKFKNTDTTFLLRSLTFFEDAELEQDPMMVKDYSWNQVKEKISKTVNEYVNTRI